MKHAGGETLDQLEPLLKRLRTLPLKEKSQGVFYRKSTAFLHFHDDPSGLYADLKVADDWQRFPVNTKEEIQTLWQEATRSMSQD